MKTAIIYSDELRNYDFRPGHPFRSNRFDAFLKLYKEKLGQNENFELVKNNELATDEELQLWHTPDYIQAMKAASSGITIPNLYRFISQDNLNPITGEFPKDIEKVARIIVKNSALALDLVQKEKSEKAVNIGGGLHHAKSNYGEGFCVYNDVVIAARYAMEKYNLERILILDTDAHAGNGTCEAFYSDPRVLFIDLHQVGIYPGTGFAQEIGDGKGRGFTVNLPLAAGTSDKSYELIFDEIILPLAEEYKPEIVVDFGYKDYIYVDTPKGNLDVGLEKGSQIDVLVTNVQDSPFLIEGSITELIKMNVHNKLKTYYDDKLSLTAKVKELIPAGYILDIYMDNVTIGAFMPNTLADVNKLAHPEVLINKTINVMLETLQQEKGVYVVSRRKYLRTLIPEEIKKLKKDVVYTGEITGTTPFGVFIQFNGCLTGMIHKMNVVEEWQEKWNQIVPGQGIDFFVKEVAKNNKIILTQSLKESLWDTIKVGKILDGKVIDVKNFGALISLDYETMGLIQTTYLTKNNASLTKGDSVKVKVISVIKGDRKIYLNLAK